jgi:heme/copper-type cytochrome/quinol oxidase subunit 3
MAFGRGPISSRLPSILSGLIVLFCAFQVASRRFGAAAGYWALFLVFFSGALVYFTEARGYALVLAGVMIAWSSWQGLVDNAQHRPVRLLGVFSGLILALASHMWALLIPACFVASAICRWLRTKTLDTGALGAMITPCLLIVSYRPIIAASRGIRFGERSFHTSLAGTAYSILHFVPYFVTVCVMVLLADSLLFPRKPDKEDFQPESTLPPEDVVLALSLMCLPAAIWAITKLMHSAFVPRYALAAILGLAFVLAQMLAFLAQRARTSSYALLMVFGLGLSAYSIRSVMQGWHLQNPVAQELASIPQNGGNSELIVYNTGGAFLTADYYATPEMASRLAFVADRQLAYQISGTDGVDSAFVLGSRHLALRGRVISYAELEQFHRSFWFIAGDKDQFDWISEKLRSAGVDMRALDVPNTRIFYVTFPEISPMAQCPPTRK